MARLTEQLRDECADLGSELIDGLFETPPWTTFLDRLRMLTAADYAIMLLRAPGRPFIEAIEILSGAISSADTDHVYHRFFHPMEPPPYQTLQEGRPYSLIELLGTDGGPHADFYKNIFVDRQIEGLRQLRVREPSGIDMWLTIARRGADFAPEVTPILQDLTSMLRRALRTYVALERERYTSALTSETARRLHFGWITLDREGHVLDADTQGEAALKNSEVISRSATGHLASVSDRAMKLLYDAIREVSTDQRGRPRTVQLSREPWFSILLLPARRRSVSVRIPPAVIAYLHSEGLPSMDRCDQLAKLFALSHNEARLALALSRGMTMTEAAAELDLSIQTVRSYSKRIYTKTGARGLHDLVRIVLHSSLAIAPDID